MRRSLADMVVVITGASSGIGAALAADLSGRGARLVLAARRVGRLQALNRALGGGHLCLGTDVADPAQCRDLIRTAADRFGRIDTLVCNAGYGLIRPVAEASAAEIERVFRTNVLGTTECVRHAVPHMRRQEPRGGPRGWRGQVVVVSSASARRGLPHLGAYSATKAAQLSLAEALRVELRPSRIAVTSAHPAGTGTEFFRAAMRVSRARPPRRGLLEARQSAGQVAASIARAIERPRPEVWPLWPFRWLLGLATLAPGVTDAILERRGMPAGRTTPPGSEGPVPAAAGGPPGEQVVPIGG